MGAVRLGGGAIAPVVALVRVPRGLARGNPRRGRESRADRRVMTTSRQYGDSEGDFGDWRDHPEPCPHLVDFDGKPIGRSAVEAAALRGKDIAARCNAKVKCRSWESHDGAYEDYQYRCEKGHVWWVDGIDA